MASYRLTPLAEQDALGIWRHIAHDSPRAADRLIDRFTAAYDLLARNPDMGQRMDEYRTGLRAWSVGNYVVYFRKTDQGIEVYRLLHAARRREDLL